MRAAAVRVALASQAPPLSLLLPSADVHNSELKLKSVDGNIMDFQARALQPARSVAAARRVQRDAAKESLRKR